MESIKLCVREATSLLFPNKNPKTLVDLSNQDVTTVEDFINSGTENPNLVIEELDAFSLRGEKILKKMKGAPAPTLKDSLKKAHALMGQLTRLSA